MQGIDVPMDVEKWIVGDEYDAAALAGLRSALRDSGYPLDDQWSAVADSQDISHREVRCPVGTLTIEVETYVGISVEGSSALVSALRAAFFAKGNWVGTLD